MESKIVKLKDGTKAKVTKLENGTEVKIAHEEVHREYKFTSAAIRILDRDGKEKIFTGRRHYEIIKDINNAGLTDQYKRYHCDGFMVHVTINDREYDVFKDRDLSTLIAKRIGIKMISNTLTSEDLW